MEYKFKFYKVVPCYDPNGDPFKFACVALSQKEYEKYFLQNGWCHFIFETFDIDCVTTIGVLFLNEHPYTTVPLSILLDDCPEFVVYPSYSDAQEMELQRELSSTSGFPDRDPELMLDERDICVGGNLYEYLHPSASAVGTCGNEQGEDK